MTIINAPMWTDRMLQIMDAVCKFPDITDEELSNAGLMRIQYLKPKAGRESPCGMVIAESLAVIPLELGVKTWHH